MIIPERAKGESSGSSVESGAEDRITRPEPQRLGPERSAQTSTAERSIDPDPSISEEVARVVKDAYDVVAENIRQGRRAAERFREGRYRISEAPADIENVAHRALGLARELSDTTFEICDRLLREMRSGLAAREREGGLPSFRSAGSDGATQPAKSADAGRMKLNVRFAGPAEAVTHTHTLERPRRPTAPGQIAVSPLASRSDVAEPIRDVRFEVDVAVEGLVVVVTLPPGQPKGIYSGLVYAGDEDVPLGVLTIEICK